MPNTTPRSTTTETDGHPKTPMPICSWPSSGSLSRRNTITFNTAPSMCTHPQSLAAPMAAHGRTPSVVSSPRSVGGVIVPKPEDPPDPSLARIGLTPAQAYQAQINLHSASPHLSQNGRSRVSVDDVPRIGVQIESGLNIDFGSDDQPEDKSNDSSSELPWAQHTPDHSRGSSCQVPLSGGHAAC